MLFLLDTMNKNCVKFLFIILLVFANHIFAQQKNLWSKIDEVKISNPKQATEAKINNYQTFQLKIKDFRDQLKNAPQKSTDLKDSKIRIQIPNHLGKMLSFKIKESPVMHPQLALRFPNNKSFIGVDENGVQVAFSINELGFYGMIIAKDRKVQYINPLSNDKKYYRIYDRQELNENNIDFQCFYENIEAVKKSSNLKVGSANDLKLRTYRLALAATGEYSEFHIEEAGVSGGTDEEKKTVVMAAMTVAITRVNSVFENELAMSLQIVPNNSDIIYLDADKDPYDNDDVEAMLNQNQTTCDNVIGSSNYDIGHVLSTGAGGVASLASICTNSDKARGVTGSSNPTGDNFYFDFIAHEMGHQLGANHTFNGDAGNCGGGNRNNNTAVEPGSGTTLMAYAGLCSPQNVQQHSDLYFHAISLDEIWSNIVSGTNNCAITTDFVSNLNSPTANAGNDFIIPVSTPYKLMGQGADADGDPITFCWEQIDNEINSIPPSELNTDGTIYRSDLPTLNNERYLPKIATVVSGSLSSKWEVTPSVAREMNFVLTVRDNNPEGGQFAEDKMKVSVVDSGGAFEVMSQNTLDLIWDVGATENITWNVAGTTGNGINTSHVNILLSIDGGKNFSIVLSSNTPNDGSQNIVVPNQTGPNCRVMVEAVDNIYYSINKIPFSVGEFVTECQNYDSVDIPKNIPDNSPSGVVSTIAVSSEDVLTDVKVSVDITHPWIADITLMLENPQGIQVELINGECFGLGNEDMDVIYDNSASALVCGSVPPVISGSIKPSEELSNFFNESPKGVWKLKVIDGNDDDVGTLNNWGLELCTSKLLPVNDYSLNNFMLYPNPSDGEFNVAFKLENENVEIYLYDLLGRKIKYLKFMNESENFNEIIDFPDVAGGIYLLQIKNGNQYSSKKIKIN